MQITVDSLISTLSRLRNNNKISVEAARTVASKVIEEHYEDKINQIIQRMEAKKMETIESMKNNL